MVFRDDREALLQRLDEAERQARELPGLRHRVAELEAENRRLLATLEELRARQAPPGQPPKPPPAASGRPVLALRIRGPYGVRDETYDAEVIKIGRIPTCHVQLSHDDVSRMHAVIERSGGGMVIIDLGSHGGTKVNGSKVNKTALVTGDTIEIGPFVMSVAIS